MKNREPLHIGDYVKYKPTGTIWRVKNIYSDGAMGEFDLAGGKLMEARALLEVEGDMGHYPIDDEIEKMIPESEIHQ